MTDEEIRQLIGEEIQKHMKKSHWQFQFEPMRYYQNGIEVLRNELKRRNTEKLHKTTIHTD